MEKKYEKPEKNGSSCSFWYDHWVGDESLKDTIGASGLRLLGLPAESKVIGAVVNGHWKLPGSRNRCPLRQSLRDLLLPTPVPVFSNGSDIFYWHYGNTTLKPFSAKATWEAIRPAAASVPWSKIVWLPVRARLSQWGISSDMCCSCGLFVETRDHLFLHCDFASQVWQRILTRLGHAPNLFLNWDALISWLSSTVGPSPRILKCWVVQATIFFIWRERNVHYHTDTSLSPEIVYKFIDRSIRDLLLAFLRTNPSFTHLSTWFT
ncbi:uncharacterized protein LOC112081610 [Eutrema salsugineum]|uniref:uncharacterized protein LOC112081610 n=1 Tax=Eutrema salsugineum TaxID=72664 RepID=UPI000CED1EF2|nr:uncharacterized protein LOC112081610 [Eutrema salsugineum]